MAFMVEDKHKNIFDKYNVVWIKIKSLIIIILTLNKCTIIKILRPI